MAGGLYSPSAGDVLTAANAIDFWSKQVVIICTSGTRPASPRSGMTCWQTDTLTYIVYGTAWCETTPYAASATGASTTTGTSYGNLADTLSTAVTVTTNTKAFVTFGDNSYQTTGGVGWTSFAVSGATTIAGSDTYGVSASGIAGSGSAISGSTTYPLTTLTAGSNVFTLKYRTTANTKNSSVRFIRVDGAPI